MRTKNSLFLFMILASLSSCENQKSESDKNEPVKVKTTRGQQVRVNTSMRFSGTVIEEQAAELSFPIPGKIEKIYVSIGQKVQKGQLIASLNPSTMKSTYLATHATLQQAEDAYKRMEELYNKGSLAEIKWVEIKSKLQQARSADELANKNLMDCKLYAPFSGIIARKEAEIGQNILPGIPIVRLTTGENHHVKIAVPETDIAKINKGQKALISIPALNYSIQEGVIQEKGVIANPMSRTYEVKIHINDTNQDIFPGMIAEVLIPDSTKEQSLVIPANILQTNEKNQNFVWINNNGKAHKCIVECGDFTADGVIIKSGLTTNDKIIIEGQQKVCENTFINDK